VDLPLLFDKEVLSRLDPTARALLRRVDRGLRAAVESSLLPRAGARPGMMGFIPLKVRNFVGSVERLVWARANGAPWTPWDWRTCAYAAEVRRCRLTPG